MNYLSSTAMLDEFAVEKIVCKRLAQSRFINSTDEQLGSFNNLLIHSHNDSLKLLNFLQEPAQDPNGIIMGYIKRVETFNIKYDYKLIAWIPTHFNTVGIGGWLLVAYYLQWVAHAKGIKKLGLTRVHTEIFASAVLDPNVLHEVWDEQKIRSKPDNLIDYATAVQSFMPGYDINW